MAKNITFDFDGSDENFEFYSGPPPVPGLYHGHVKDMSLGKIAADTVNKGKHRINMTLVIDQGKYNGAIIYHNLNVTKDGAKYVNGFIDSLTDGSEEHIKAARAAFWKGKLVVDESKRDAKGNNPVLRLGSKVVSKGDLKCWFMTKVEPDNNGVDRTRIARFVVQRDGEEQSQAESQAEDDDPLGVFVDESAEEAEESAVVDLDSEEDDPWGDVE